MNHFRIPEMAKQYTEYDMIQSHTELPDFPVSQARLLCAFLDRNESKRDGSSELYALAASLVQLGLDTHQMVSVTNQAKEKPAVRSRQLKVLAGDYFSSRFYHLLAQAGQIDMITQIASAICEANRLKMTLYTRIKQLKLTAEDYFQQNVNIRMQLFLGFNRLMEGVYNRIWPDFLQGFIRCDVLVGEIIRSETVKQFRGSWGYWHIIQNGTKEERRLLEADVQDDAKLWQMVLKYNIKGQLFHMLEEQVQQVWSKIRQLDCENLAQELYHIGEPFRRFAMQPKVLEER